MNSIKSYLQRPYLQEIASVPDNMRQIAIRTVIMDAIADFTAFYQENPRAAVAFLVKERNDLQETITEAKAEYNFSKKTL